jgi:hypothetical protein
MSEQIEPGDGWRLLGPDEPIKAGDEFWRDAIPLFKHEAGWIPTISGFIGLVAHGFKIRRRIPAKPEAMEIGSWLDVEVSKKSNDMILYTRNVGANLNAEQARQLAAYASQYADWREAQELNK